MAQPMNADLHCHSTVSDGTLEPEALAARAKANGVELWALTDHDELGGQQRARDAARALGLPYLTGVEISVTFIGTTVHIVGLGVDSDDAALRHGLVATRGGRGARALQMADELAKAGIAGTYEGALRHAGNHELISRTHFARHLVETGVCADTHEVFRRFLVEGKPGFVAHRWAALGDAVGWIVAAGGVAVIAHPARYRFSATEEYALFTEFKGHGGSGVEVTTGSHTAAEAERYANTAREFDLLASRGSDFHSPDESRIDLGGLPPLPTGLTPVWEALQSRVQRSA
ncbi:MAG TPA: 3',5'-nucleoside bisphosphate phosphatase [Caldimonas sp.]|nr:3',5'-nucleoside bisphosphate phosphatase [Caldimonas sp.]